MDKEGSLREIKRQWGLLCWVEVHVLIEVQTCEAAIRLPVLSLQSPSIASFGPTTCGDSARKVVAIRASYAEMIKVVSVGAEAPVGL